MSLEVRNASSFTFWIQRISWCQDNLKETRDGMGTKGRKNVKKPKKEKPEKQKKQEEKKK
jgi:hypothetical protein